MSKEAETSADDAPSPERTHTLSGGLVPLGMAVPTAFAAWKMPLYTMPSTTLWIGAAALALLGAAILVLRFRVPNPQDYFGGLALSGLGLFAIWASHELGAMRGFAFGPGTAPRLFAVLLAGNGALVTVGGLLSHGPDITRYAWRGLLFITASVMVFALTVRSTGLVISTFVTAVVCAAAAADIRWRETMVVAIALTILCAILFPYVLNLPMPLWPRF